MATDMITMDPGNQELGVVDAFAQVREGEEVQRGMARRYRLAVDTEDLRDVLCADDGDEKAARRVQGNGETAYLLDPRSKARPESRNANIGLMLARKARAGVWDLYQDMAARRHLLEDQQGWKPNDYARRIGEMWQEDERQRMADEESAYQEFQGKVQHVDTIMPAYLSGAGFRDAEGDDAGRPGTYDEYALTSESERALFELNPELGVKARQVREDIQQLFGDIRPGGDYEDVAGFMDRLEGMQDFLMERIGEDQELAQLYFYGLMGLARQWSDTRGASAGDEFLQALGQKVDNWTSLAPVAGNLMIAGQSEDVEAINRAQENMREAMAERERTAPARRMLAAAKAQAMEVGNASPWEAVLREYAKMGGDTLPYLTPGIGMALGTADTMVAAGTQGVDAAMAQYAFGGNPQGYESEGAAAADVMLQGAIGAAVEFGAGRVVGKVAGLGAGGFGVGGKGLAASLRSVAERGAMKVGAISERVAGYSMSSFPRALAAEAGAAVLDEAVIEPVTQGMLQYGTGWLMDQMGVPHGKARAFADCFDELQQIWGGDRTTLGGLMLFCGTLAGARSRGLYNQVKWFALNKENLGAAGAPGHVVAHAMEIKDIDKRVEYVAGEMQRCWTEDPEGTAQRMLEENRRLAEAGKALAYTGKVADAEINPGGALDKAYQASWQRLEQLGWVPHVEAVADGKFRVTRSGKGLQADLDVTTTAQGADVLLRSEIDRAEQAYYRATQQKLKVRGEVAQLAGDIAGEAATRAVKEHGGQGMKHAALEELLPADIVKQVKARGYLSEADMQDLLAYTEGVLDGAAGVADTGVLDRWRAAGIAESFGDMQAFARGLLTDWGSRNELAGGQAVGTTAFRMRQNAPVEIDGRKMLGSTVLTLGGRASSTNVLEEVVETYLDQVVQARAAELTDADDAAAAAWREVGDVVSRVREQVLKVDPKAKVEEVDASRPMSVVEAFSSLAMSEYLTSPRVPDWMRGVQAAMKGCVSSAGALEGVRVALETVDKAAPEVAGKFRELLDSVEGRVATLFERTRVEERDVESWRHAVGLVEARVNAPGMPGGASVSRVVAEAEEEDKAILEREQAEPIEREEKPAAVEAHAGQVLAAHGDPTAPDAVRRCFVGGNCVHNESGNYYVGLVAKGDIREGAIQQVKVGEKGAHGVIAGRELTGDFESTAAPLYLWLRQNGELQLISGRHRFAKLMEDTNVQSHLCYVFVEGESFAGVPFDERWAKMLDYENNMRDDQADEVTAGTYARETGHNDEYMRRKGLLRNASRSKRGIFIGRQAGDELWTRFANGAVSPKDAEIICQLTAPIKDRTRVADIQTTCCTLLDQKKSWEYIGAMAQLLANKEAVTLKQGLLDLGADFEADMDRMARFVEKNLQSLSEAISVLKGDRKLAKKGSKATRLGVSAQLSEEEREQRIADLERIKAEFELIGSNPELIAQAQLWDGKTELDPVARYLEQAQAAREQEARESGMDADEYLEEQAAKRAAAEAVPSLFGSMSVVNEEEMGAIRAAAVETGTFMKAPNGEPTNLTERQWLQVRTRAFKDWFGDWEREASLTFDDTQYSNKDCLEALAKETGKPFVNDETGISADINRKQRDKITSGKAQRKSKDAGFSTGTHNYVAAHIRDLFKYAVHLGDYKDAQSNPDIHAIKRFACPARINGELAYVYMTVKETKLYGHRIYTLELDTIEKLGGNLDDHFKEMLNPTPSGVILQKLKEKVNTFFENSSKIVDENGEPLVVWHGTPERFNVFDRTKTRANMDIQGNFFTPWELDAQGYGENVRAFFLNIRKPAGFQQGYAALNKFKGQNGAGVKARELLVSQGYDGVDNGDEYITFEPEQVKSATENRGTFDGRNPDITFSLIMGEKGAARLTAAVDVLGNLRTARGILGRRKWHKLTRQEQVKIKLATGWEQDAEGHWVLESPDLNQVFPEPNLKYAAAAEEAYKEHCEAAEEAHAIWERGKKEKLTNAEYTWRGELVQKSEAAWREYNRQRDLYRKSGLPKGALKMEDFIKGTPYEEAYPELKGIKVECRVLRGCNGYFAPLTKTICIDKDCVDPQRKLEIVLHEIQHVIQDIEGWGKGGDSRTLGKDNYRRLTGEVAARNAARRKYMPVGERNLLGALGEYQALLEDTEDVARENQLVRDSHNTLKRGLRAVSEMRMSFSTADGPRNLAAVHSISADKLEGVLRLGGMPFPSIAVTRLDSPYKFGGAHAIALVGKPVLGMPGDDTPVYFHDAYSGKMPTLYSKVSDPEGLVSELRYKVIPTLDKYGLKIEPIWSKWAAGIYDDTDALDLNARTSRGFQAYWAVAVSGADLKPAMKKNMDGMVQPWAKLDARTKRLLRLWHGEVAAEGRTDNTLTNGDIRKFASIMRAYMEAHPYENDAAQKARLANFPDVEDYSDYDNAGVAATYAAAYMNALYDPDELERENVPDVETNRRNIEAYLDEHIGEFRKWANAFNAKYIGQQVFREHVVEYRKGVLVKDEWRFTPATLENLTRYMEKKKAVGKEFSDITPGMFLALMGERVESRVEMDAMRDRVISSDDFAKINAQYEDQFYHYWDAIADRQTDEAQADICDEVLRRIVEMKQSGEPMEDENIREHLERVKGVDWNEELLDRVCSLVHTVMEMPSDYMEAIPQRAVKLEEFVYALVPRDMQDNAAVKEALKVHGIKPIYHDGSKYGYAQALAGLVGSGVAFSTVDMEVASTRALALLEGRADEAYAVEMAKRFRRKLEQLQLFRLGDERDEALRLGRGAQLLAELTGLVDSAEAVLGQAAHTGRLAGLLRWCKVYAQMMQEGRAPAGGELKGGLYDEFTARMRKMQEGARLNGLTDDEVRETMASYAGERLDAAFDKVARHVVECLDGFVKARARERMDYIHEHVYPKREEGQKWPRGKMSADAYRRVERVYQLMEMDSERVATLIESAKRELAELQAEGVEDEEQRKREAELEDELALLSLYGDWEHKSAQEATRAAAAFADDVLHGRREWDERLRAERRRLAWERREIQSHFRGSKDEQLARVARENAAASSSDLKAGGRGIRAFMNFSHLLHSLEKKLGKRWTTRMRRGLADIHTGMMQGNQELQEWLLTNVREVTGLTSEMDMQSWLEDAHELYDTGITLELPGRTGRCRMTPAEAYAWLRMSREEREARREELQSEFEERRELPDNVPTEEQIEELRHKVASSYVARTARGKELLEEAKKEAREMKVRRALEEREAELGRMLTREETAQVRREASQLSKEEWTEVRENVLAGLMLTEDMEAEHQAEGVPQHWELKGNEANPQKLYTSKANMLQAVLTFEQPDYEHLMEPNGITPAILWEMKKQIGPKLLELGYRMRERLNENGEDMAEVYERLTGIPFGFRANYYRGIFDVNKAAQLGEAVDRESGSALPSGKHGMLIPRRYHMSRIPWTQNVSALSVFLDAMRQQTRYTLTAEYIHDARGLLERDSDFKQALAAEIGEDASKLMTDWLHLVEGAQIATTKWGRVAQYMLGKAMRGSAIAYLAFNFGTYLKQSTAILNCFIGGYIPDKLGYEDGRVQVLAERGIKFLEMVDALGRVASGKGHVTLAELKADPMFKSRAPGEGNDLMESAQLGADRKSGTRLGKGAKRVAELGMKPIYMLDIFFNKGGAAVLYEATWASLERNDPQGKLTAEDKDRICRETLRTMLDFAAQPVLRTQMSYHAAAKTLGGIGQMLFLFRSEGVKNFGVMLSQLANGEYGRAAFTMLGLGVMVAAAMQVIDWLRGYSPDDEDEDRYWKMGSKFVLDSLTNDLTSVPGLEVLVQNARWGVEEAISAVSGANVVTPEYRSASAPRRMVNAVKREVKNIEQGAPWQKHVRAVAQLTKIAGPMASFGVTGRSAAVADAASLAWTAAACGNLARYVADVYDRVMELATGDEAEE